MRHSELRHTVAVLRNIIGEKQDGFARLVGCSLATVQSIEANTGRLSLSRALAERIALETGIDLNWLMANDTKKQPVDAHGRRYTKQTYLTSRANAEADAMFTKDLPPLAEVWFGLPQVLVKLFGMYVDAAGSGELRLLHFRVAQSLRDLTKEMKLRGSSIGGEMVGAGKDAQRFDIQPLADAFWSEMQRIIWSKQEARQRSSVRRAK